jgi:serine/threonine protein kinase
MEFKAGTKIALSYGNDAEVVRKLGEGFQGIVYEVIIGGKSYALKWYICTFAKKDLFIKNMKEKIIKNGAPDEKFLWPLFFAEEQQDSFGYVMDLRPKEYADFEDFLNAKIRFPSMEKRILTALNFVTAFRALHRKGFSYQDLNDGNFFINMETGDVLVCDNDNVTPGDSENFGQIGGKPGYMAPEVVTGAKHPSSLTDYYSLAVILFKLFIVHDPLMGANYVKLTKKDTLPVVELELYGKNPIFIFDPKDTSNRPDPKDHKNPINLWPLYPKFFQDAFIASFGEGSKNPNARLTENVWQSILIRLRDEISTCPKCKEEIVFWAPVGKTTCDGCGSVYSPPSRISVNNYHAPVFSGQKLYTCHTSDQKDNYAAITGEITVSKNDPSKFGLRNLSDDAWTYTSAKGETLSVARGGVVPLNGITSIGFKKVTAQIGDGKTEAVARLVLQIKNYQLPLSGGQKLYACHTLQTSSDSATVTGEVVINKKNPGLIGIRNLSDDEWTFASPDGEKKVIKKNEVAPVSVDSKTGMSVNFKDISGKIVVI